MTLKINITSETEAALRDRAAQAGQDLETFVLHALAEKLIDGEGPSAVVPPNGQEWRDKLQSCIELHPVTLNPVDDSRESIYSGRE